MAFDVGVKRTGVAFGQTINKQAKPVKLLALTRGRFEWSQIDQLIDDWQPTTIVLGEPNSHDPALNKVINRLKSHIQQQHKLPIVSVNETLTSHAANQEMAELRMKAKEKTLYRDQIAACLILESYFALH